MSLTLDIAVGGVTYTYDDARIATGSPVRSVRLDDDGAVEQADVEVSVHAASLGPWASPFEIPAGAFRARLLSTDETGATRVVVDGTMERTVGNGFDDPAEAGPEPGLRTWSVRVVDGALAEVRRRLGVVDLRSHGVGAKVVAYGGVLRIDTRDDHTADPEFVRWWNCSDLLYAAVVQAGFTSPEAPLLFPNIVRYLDAQGAAQVLDLGDAGFVCSRAPLADDETPGEYDTIPDMSGLDWLETMADLTGLTYRAHYALWPSEAISVDFAEAPAALAAPTPLLVAGEMPEPLAGYDGTFEPAVRGPIRYHSVGSVTGGVAEALPVMAQASDLAGSGEPTADFRLPRISNLVQSSLSGLPLTATFGLVAIAPTEDEPYLATAQGSGILREIRPDDPIPGEPLAYNPTWATRLAERQPLRLADTVELQFELDADLAGELEPGSLMTLEAAECVVVSVDLEVDTRAQAITARARAYQAPPPAPGPTPVPTLTSSRYQETVNGTERTYTQAEASPASGSSPDAIELQVQLDTGGPWYGYLGPVVVEAGRVVSFRARATYAYEGVVTDWVEVLG